MAGTRCSACSEKLENLVQSLEKNHPGAATSLREGLIETLTINRMGIPDVLQTSLKSTNIIESAFDITRNVVRNIKRWMNGEQVLRWSATGLLEAEKRFRRIKGYRELPLLRTALQQKLNIETNRNKQERGCMSVNNAEKLRRKTACKKFV